MLLLLFVPPRLMVMRRPRDMSVKTMGVKIHANLPSFPMMVLGWDVVCSE